MPILRRDIFIFISYFFIFLSFSRYHFYRFFLPVSLMLMRRDISLTRAAILRFYAIHFRLTRSMSLLVLMLDA